MYFPCPSSREFDAKVLCVSLGQLYDNSISCVLPVSCVTFLSVACCSSWKLGITWSVVHFSASSVSFSGLHDNAVSYALLSQLCTSPSVVHYSVSCVLLCQLCITRSVVYYPVSCLRLGQLCYISQLDDNSVSCLLLRQLKHIILRRTDL